MHLFLSFFLPHLAVPPSTFWSTEFPAATSLFPRDQVCQDPWPHSCSWKQDALPSLGPTCPVAATPWAARPPLKRAWPAACRRLRQDSVFWVSLSSGASGLPLGSSQGLQLRSPGLVAHPPKFHSVGAVAYVECGSCWGPPPLAAYCSLSDIKTTSRTFPTV